MDGEHVRAWWPTRLGFLVVSNLRCVPVWKPPGLLGFLEGQPWHTGPEFLFLDFAPPTAVGGRYVELREESIDGAATRIEVEDPQEVVATIDAARTEGRLEWSRRRADLDLHRPAVSAPVARLPPVPCAYCGTRFDRAGSRCPSCGAPRPPA
ncbi:MAG: hypothetical protein ACREDK_05740 [Thermoplasmata archaeon]